MLRRLLTRIPGYRYIPGGALHRWTRRLCDHPGCTRDANYSASPIGNWDEPSYCEEHMRRLRLFGYTR